MWLNVGCVLHLQVADSIPAQVSDSQSVFCVCAVPPPLPILSSFAPFFIPPPSSPLRAISPFSGNVGMDTATPPPFFFPHLSPAPSLISIACTALIFRATKKPGPPLLFHFHPNLQSGFVPPSVPKPDSDHCLETARRDFLIWQDVMSPEL